MELRTYDDALASNLVPHSQEKPRYYVKCLQFFKEFVRKHPNVPLQGLSVKTIYKHLLDEKREPFELINKFPAIDFRVVFKNFSTAAMSPECRDVTYRTIHHVLQVRERLFRFSIARHPFCGFCRQRVETISHLFCQCNISVEVWTFMSDLFFKLCNHRLKPTYDIVVFGILPKIKPAVMRQLIYVLISIYKYCVWVKRCEVVFGTDKKVSSIEIFRYILYIIKSRVLADKNRWSAVKFKSFWCQNNIIAAQIEDEFQFLL